MRLPLLFLAAVLVPCAVLGWLGWRSLGEEQALAERQQLALCQSAADATAGSVRALLADAVRSFAASADGISREAGADAAGRFPVEIGARWPMAGAAGAIDLSSLAANVEIHLETVDSTLAFQPSLQEAVPEAAPPADFAARDPAAGGALPDENLQDPKLTESPGAKDRAETRAASNSPEPVPAAGPVGRSARATADAMATGPEFNESVRSEGQNRRQDGKSMKAAAMAVESAKAESRKQQFRIVRPLHVPPGALDDRPLPSAFEAADATLYDAVLAEPSGVFSRPREDGQLVTLFWHRAPSDDSLVFLAAPESGALNARIDSVLPSPEPDMFVAVLDQTGTPVARRRGTQVPPGYSPDSWRNPFTASEIGAELPFWEAAVWIADSAAPAAAGRSAKRRLALTVSLALAAAAAGAWLLLQEHRRTALDARRKRDFVSNVSHELRTPLTSIRMFSDLLRAEPPPSPDKSARYACIIGDEAARLTRLIDSLLDFSRLEHRRLPLQPADGDLRVPVEEAAAHCRPQLTDAGLALHLDLPPTPLIAHFDRDAVIRILTNLFSNAAKYGRPPGGSGNAPEVKVRLQRCGGDVTVSVADGGAGIPADQARRVFRKFERGSDSLAAGIPGSGLGLTLARELARAMSGNLTYQPAEGGAPHAFVLTLPAVPDS